jgi:hypothetical protein
MQARLSSHLNHPIDLELGYAPPSPASSKDRSRGHGSVAASGSAFKLTVLDMQSAAAPIERMLRAALTNCLIRLEQRVRISSSREPVYSLEAIVRNTRRSRCQAVALFEQLRRVGVRQVQWVSVIDVPSAR